MPACVGRSIGQSRTEIIVRTHELAVGLDEVRVLQFVQLLGL